MTLPGNTLIKRIIVAVIATIVIVWFYPHQNSHKFLYEQGRPWNYAQLIAPFDIPIHPDSVTVENIRDTLSANFVPIYINDATAVDSVIADLPSTITSTNKVQLTSILKRIYKNGIVDSDTKEKINDGKLPKIRILEGNIISEHSTKGLISPRDIYEKIDSLIPDVYLRNYFVSSDIHKILRANLVYDEVANKRLFDNEFLALTADRGVIQQGQAVINKGDIVTPQDYTNLKTYEQLLEARESSDNKSAFIMLIGQFLYVAILLALLLVYCLSFAPRIYKNFRAMVFIYLLVTIFFLISTLLNRFVPGAMYIVPIAIIPVLILAFFEGRSAMFVAILAILLCAPISSFALEYIFLQFSAAAVAIYALGELRSRSQLMRMASWIAITYIVGYLGLELLLNGSFESLSWRTPIFLLANAVLSSLAYILMFASERMFGFVSNVTLVELADVNQPLLQRLSDTCPGTFQHAMSVSNLAADAARAMGANEQLVRAGALYHDIGKMANPAFFTENQHGVNPHDTLPPEQSARIVIGHVTEGLKLADKEGLPKVIKDFITQHHGAGKAKYFYYMYCKAHSEEQNPDASAFTYPGPNPTSRETSLLMMADAVEAASRSLAEYTRQSIAELVDKVIDAQIAEGLHADSTLEFRDIAIIKEAFIKRLMTMYHTRVAYPSAATAPQAPQK